MTRVIFIDMGETIVSFSPKFHQPIFEFLKREGYKVTEKQVFRAVYKIIGKDHFPDPILGGLSVLDYKELLLQLKISPKPSLIKKIESLSLLSDKWELYEDAEIFLKKLKDEKFKVIMITNATRSVYKIISDLGLEKYLDDVIASCDYGIMKPHPRIFRIAVEKYGNPKFHIGDVYEIDYLGALKANIKPILLDRFNFYDDLKVDKVNNLLQALELARNH